MKIPSPPNADSVSRFQGVKWLSRHKRAKPPAHLFHVHLTPFQPHFGA